MKTFNKLPVPINQVKRISQLYNKAFHTKVFTLWASSESEVYTLAKLHRPCYDFCLVFIKNADGLYFLDDRGVSRVRNSILKSVKNSPREIFRLYRAWQKHWQAYLKFSDELLQITLPELSNPQLFALMEKFYRRYQTGGGLAYVCDSFMSMGERDWMETLLEAELKRAGNRGDLPAAIGVLTFPLKPSYALAEDYDLGKMALNLRKQFPKAWPKFESLATQHPLAYRQLLQHERRYFWTRNNYYNVDYYDAKQIWHKIQNFDTKEFLAKSRQTLAMRRQHRQLIKKIKFNPFAKNLVKTAQLFASWKDIRKSGVYLGMHHFDRFLGEIATRKKMNKLDVACLVLPEIQQLLFQDKNFDAAIQQRKKQTFFTVTPKGYFIAGGQAANRYFKILAGAQSAQTQELRGVAASAGTATGRVRIIKNSEDMKQFRRGEILVINQTTPEFVPVMRLAAAIVTEQGGITSHAAIISRELHKPCVIGTKIATQVLKTGDRVKVNARTGLVKKLN